MLDIIAFRLRYPEFQSADDPFVQAMLDDAAKRVDPDVWGTWADEGHGLLTAHKLSLSPNGQMARLANEKGESTYGTEYEKLKIAASALIRVF